VVSEHRIRLRGGWECESVDPPSGAPYRLTLPTRWAADGPRRLRLTRQFNQPPVQTGSRVVVRLQQVPGIRSLEVNGQAAVPVSPGCTEYEVLLDASGGPRRLVLDVDTTNSSDPTSPPIEWGDVALVIRSE
jgi:hypothetical protein